MHLFDRIKDYLTVHYDREFKDFKADYEQLCETSPEVFWKDGERKLTPKEKRFLTLISRDIQKQSVVAGVSILNTLIPSEEHRIKMTGITYQEQTYKLPELELSKDLYQLITTGNDQYLKAQDPHQKKEIKRWLKLFKNQHGKVSKIHKDYKLIDLTKKGKTKTFHIKIVPDHIILFPDKHSNSKKNGPSF